MARLIKLFIFTIALVASSLYADNIIDKSNGLPNLQVISVAQDQNGYIWIATGGGLVRYNGKSVKKFGKESGLDSVVIFSIFVDSQNILWLGTSTGVMKFTGKSFEYLNSDVDIGIVNTIRVDSSNTVWVASTQGLFSGCSTCELKKVSTQVISDVNFTEILFDAQENIWLLNENDKLYKYNRKNKNFEKLNDFINSLSIIDITSGPKNNLLLATENVIYELDADAQVVSKIISNNSFESLQNFVFHKGNFYVKLSDEIQIYKKNEQWQLDKIQDMSLDVNSIIFDNMENMWIATQANGLVKKPYTQAYITSIEMPCPGAVLSINSVLADQSKYLIGGGRCSGTLDKSSGQVTEISELRNLQTWDMKIDRYGRTYAMTSKGLYFKEPNQEFVKVTIPSKYLNTSGSTLHIRDDILYAGSLAGLISLKIEDQNSESALTIIEEHDIGYVYTLNMDKWNRLWAGTIGNGLFYEDENGKFKRVEFEGQSDAVNTTAISFDGVGDLISVYSKKNLQIKFDKEGGFKDIRLSDSIYKSDLSIWAMLAVDNNYWVGASDGLKLFDIKDSKSLLHITGRMGLGEGEFTTSRSLLSVEDGFLAGTSTGLYTIETKNISQKRSVADLKLDSIKWSNVEEIVDTQEQTTSVDVGKWTHGRPLIS